MKKKIKEIIMKNVISFSLWGEKPMYWVGALRNIELANQYYPGWICRFYVDKNSRKDLIDTLKGDNVEVVLVNPTGYNDNPYFHHGMLWRFSAAVGEDIDIFLSRDCDSRISEREVSAVNEWLRSDKDFHIMREIGLMDKINQWCSNGRNSYSAGIDQDFLREIVYPLVKDRAMEHSEFNLNYGGEVRNFPYIRKDYEFIGDVFDENELRHPDYWKIIKNKIG